MVDTNQASGTTPPSRARARVVSAACDSLPRRSNSRNPEVPLIVWKKRKMPSRSERSVGAFSQATRSLLNASRFSFVSSRKSSSRSSMPHSPRLQGQGFGPALVNLGLRPPGREVSAEQQNPFLGFRHVDRSAGFLHQAMGKPCRGGAGGHVADRDAALQRGAQFGIDRTSTSLKSGN